MRGALKKVLVTLVLALPFVLALGFCVFVVAVTKVPTTLHLTTPPVDVAVVFTGSRERIPAAMALMHDNVIQKVFISGVSEGVRQEDLALLHPYVTAPDPRVELGHAASNTFENVMETAQWVHNHGVKRLYLITSTYHMPRSLFLLQAALPHVELIPLGVSLHVPPQDMEAWFRRVRLIVLEYAKLLNNLVSGDYVRILRGRITS